MKSHAELRMTMFISVRTGLSIFAFNLFTKVPEKIKADKPVRNNKAVEIIRIIK